MSAAKIVAVTDALKDGSTGSIVMWSLNGGLNMSRLQISWSCLGLPEEWLPESCSPEVAFSRACKDQEQKHQLVRAHPKGGFVIVAEKMGDDAFDYSGKADCHVTLNKIGRVVCDPSDHPVAQAVKDAFDLHLEQPMTVDASAWLTGLMVRLDAVGLRATGGVYFIPAHRMAVWEKVREAIEKATTHTIYDIPAMPSDRAAEALLDALAQECTSAASEIEEECKADDAKLGTRALKSRIAATENVKSKIQRYESLFGAQLTDLHVRLDRLKAALTTAVFKTESGVSNPLGDFAQFC